MYLVRVFLLIFVAIATVQCFDFGKILENVSEEDVKEFLKFHLQYGYKLTHAGNTNEQKIKDFQKGIPKEFSINFYKYAAKYHHVRDENLLNAVREIVCFDDGTCIDIGDPGLHP